MNLWHMLTSGIVALSPSAGLELATPEQLRAIPLASLPYAGSDLPGRVDLRSDLPPPGYQGAQNSCVGWVTAYALKSYQERIESGHELTEAGKLNPQKVFSPAYVYNQLNQRRDGGITYIDALNLLGAQGAAPWADMPYDPTEFRRQPTAAIRRKAKTYRIDYWRQVNVMDPRELKAHLQAGYPVMLGMMVDQGFFQHRGTGVWQADQGRSLGAHALLLVAYDDQRQAFGVFNSWGPRWADQGTGWIGYRQFARMVREGFVAKDAINASTLSYLSQPAPTGGALNRDELATQPAPATSAKSAEAFEHEQSLVDANPLRFTSRWEPTGHLTLSGQVYIDPASARHWHVVVRWFEGNRPLVAALPQFRDAQGQAVASTAPQATKPGWQTWQIQVPRSALGHWDGHKPLQIKAVLYLDGFGAEVSHPHRLPPLP